MVLEGDDMEGEERMLLVRNHLCPRFALYASPRIAASTPSLVWMSAWTSRSLVECRRMLSTCAARGACLNVGLEMETCLISFQT